MLKMVVRVWPPVVAVYLPGLLFFRAKGDPTIMGTVMVLNPQLEMVWQFSCAVLAPRVTLICFKLYSK